MRRKVLDIYKLMDDLYKKSGEQYKFEYQYIGDDYQYGFIHCTKSLDISMEDYDGFDEFGSEDNQLYIYCRFRGKKYENLYDSHDNLFVSHSIKTKDIFKDKSTGKIFINPDSIKDWKIFKKLGNIDKYCCYCSNGEYNEPTFTIGLIESEINYLYDLVSNKDISSNRELLRTLNYAKQKANSKSLNELFGNNSDLFCNSLKFEPL